MTNSCADISLADIAGAERLADTPFTDAERALMLDNIAGQIEHIRQRRAVALPPSLAPATRFDPRLPGFAPPATGPFRPHDGDAPDLPADEADIAFSPVWMLSRWLRAGRISATRLTQVYLDRLRRIGPTLQCVATLTPELALRQAAQADAELAAGQWRGPLHGVPYGCKDILDTAGIVTDWGAEPYRGRVPERDASVVRQLRDAGAVLLGKLSVGALAFGDIWHGGRTRNPWNPAEGSSGSSAGSAAAVAAGLVGFAIGTETLGSIVAPSLRCGVTGLRPTFGRVSRAGAMPLCWSLDKIGPMARAVEDTALILNAILARDAEDPSQIALPFGHDAAASVVGLRLGYFPADFAEPLVNELDRAALDAARGRGLELVELTRPARPYGALMDILAAESAAAFEELTLSDRDDLLTWQEPRAWPNSFRKAHLLPAVHLVQLDRLRRQAMQDMADSFSGVDAIIGPPLAGPMLVITNMTGHPCLVVPCGLREQPTRAPGQGGGALAPHAICLWGRLFDEGVILRLGRALEAAFGQCGRRPPLKG